jgi:hypothetical protein
MALVITGIGDKGNLNSERVGFRVTSKGDLKYFIVLTTQFTEIGFYNRSKDAFWFAPEDVQTGDKVVLYTKSGTDSFKTNDDGTKTFFKYWGLSQPIFTDNKKGIVVAEVDNWSLSKKY